MLDALKTAMKKDFYIAVDFEPLTPGYILSRKTLELYDVIKSRNKDSGIESENPTLGTGEWINDGVRFYKYLNETYQIPMQASTRPGTRYVYDHEKNKWVLPGNF